MQNRTSNNDPQHHARQRNLSMSEHDKQKTVSNPSPGSSDPGNENKAKGRAARRRS
jgi:hypothetical protein